MHMSIQRWMLATSAMMFTAMACEGQGTGSRMRAGDSSRVSAPGAAVATPVTTGPVASLDTATFAGGCFWCMEPPFDKLTGVVSTTSGYMGGTVRNPTYDQVSAGGTGHAEVVQVVFDPSRITYPRLLEVFWRNIDPLTPNRQFCDKGDQYRSAIFVHDEEQDMAARASLDALEKSRRFKEPIVTKIEALSDFTPAEAYHQDYYQRNPIRYKYYRGSCGRDARLKQLWK
jgi:peptide-methionine (S)-S-oxide reductase